MHKKLFSVRIDIYKWLEANDPHCGVYIEYSIDKLNEIFQTNERK